jgi:hypothetical protein
MFNQPLDHLSESLCSLVLYKPDPVEVSALSTQYMSTSYAKNVVQFGWKVVCGLVESSTERQVTQVDQKVIHWGIKPVWEIDCGEGWVVVVFDVAQELVCAQCPNGDILSLELKTSEVCWSVLLQ